MYFQLKNFEPSISVSNAGSICRKSIVRCLMAFWYAVAQGESVCLKIDCFFLFQQWFKKKYAANKRLQKTWGRKKLEAAKNIFAAYKLHKTSRRPPLAAQMFCTACRPFFSNKMHAILEPDTQCWCCELVALPMTGPTTRHQYQQCYDIGPPQICTFYIYLQCIFLIGDTNQIDFNVFWVGMELGRTLKYIIIKCTNTYALKH